MSSTSVGDTIPEAVNNNINYGLRLQEKATKTLMQKNTSLEVPGTKS